MSLRPATARSSKTFRHCHSRIDKLQPASYLECGFNRDDFVRAAVRIGTIPNDISMSRSTTTPHRRKRAEAPLHAVPGTSLRDRHASLWEKLRQQGYSIMRLLNDMPDPVILIDPDGRIRYVNPALEKMSRYSAAEIVGTKAPYPWWPKNRVDEITDIMKMALEVGANRVEQRFVSKQGQEFWVYVSSIPISINGSTSYCLGRWVDITERKQAEEHLQESDKRYRLLAENVSDVIWVTDLDLNLNYVSPSVARVRGYTAEETMEQKVSDILTPASLEAAHQALARDFMLGMRKAKDASGTTTLELSLTCRDGSTAWTEFKMSLLRDADGRPVGTIGVSRDITERRRAQEKTAQHSRELAALHRVLMSTTQTLSLNEVLREIVSQVGRAVGSAYTRIVLTDRDGHLLASGEHSGEMLRLPFGSQQRKVARRVMATGETLVENAIGADEVTNPVLATGIQSYACAPIRSKNATIGVMFVHSKQRDAFSDKTDLLAAFADQAAIAIENARLYEAVRAERSHVEELLGQVLTAQENERRRLSLELHDTIAQSLYGALAHISAADELLRRSKLGRSRKELDSGKKALDQTLLDLRAVAAGLHPPALDAVGLVRALSQHIDKLNLGNHGIKFMFDVQGKARKLPPNQNIGIYRIVQEALNNTTKHSAASEVHVRLRFLETMVVVEVRDNGKGFVFRGDITSEAAEGHMGLAGIIERSELLGGSLDIKTHPGAGTSIIVSVLY